MALTDGKAIPHTKLVMTDFGESHQMLQVNEVSAKCECEAGPGVGLPLDEFASFVHLTAGSLEQLVIKVSNIDR